MRDRHAIGRKLAVGHDQDVVTTQHRVLGIGTERGQARFDAFLAPFGRIADVQLGRAELVLRVARDVADLGHAFEVQHRLAHLEAERRVDLVDLEQVRLRPDEGHERHHHLLADRVDRRVGDLREELAEVVVERLVLGRQHRQRRVVAHGAGGLLARLAHRLEDELDVFLGEAEGLLAVEQRCDALVGCSGVEHGWRLEGVELDVDAAQPVGVGLGVGQRLLQLLVADDAALFHVDQEHLARLQAPLLDDLAVGNRQHARLGGHHDEVVVGDEIARRTQAVTVERGADLATVGEGHRGGAVPRLHHRRMVFVEGAALLVHLRVRLPGLRDHHHHRVGKRVAAHHQQFERVVEGRRVGLARIDQRPDLLQIFAQQRRMHALLARAHPVVVAAERVDLAVVGDVAERVGEVPLREGVGREALVHQRQRGHRTRIEQVGIVLADLVGQQQALVVHRACRHRHHVELFAVLEVERADGVRGAATHDVELALERLGHHHVGPAADEDLADHRLLGLHGRRHRHVVIDRDVAPAEHDLAFGHDRTLDLFFTGQARSGFLGHEHHAHAVLTGQRKAHAQLRHLLPVELVRDLDQDACAIALQRVGTDRTAVIQVLQDLEALQHDVVGFPALDVGDETHAAGIMFIGGVVKTLLLGQIHLLFLKRQRSSRVRGRASPKNERAQKSRARAHRLCGLHQSGAYNAFW